MISAPHTTPRTLAALERANCAWAACPRLVAWRPAPAALEAAGPPPSR